MTGALIFETASEEEKLVTLLYTKYSNKWLFQAFYIQEGTCRQASSNIIPLFDIFVVSSRPTVKPQDVLDGTG